MAGRPGTTARHGEAGPEVPAAAMAVLTALVAGQELRRGAAGWTLARDAVPAAVIETLAAAGLVAVERRVVLPTPAGRRAAAPSASAGRRLVERAMPFDKGTTAVRSVTVNLAESPLGWLRARGMVSERQHLAGERLREDWERAQLGPRVTMRWDRAPGGGSRAGAPEPGSTAIAAKARFDAAIAAAGPGLADVLWRVACAGEGLAAAEEALGWPKRAAKLVLTLALDRVADFYRIA